MRTENTGVMLSTNSNWYVEFTTYIGDPGSERVSAVTTSAAIFTTEEQAYAGAQRALDTLVRTGAFPNMCVIF